MFHVAIVDDEKSMRKQLREYLAYVAETKKVSFSVREFADADSFLVHYEPEYDIVFMDIELGGTSGMEAARMLRKVDKVVLIVFVTNLAQMAIQGYEVDALDFIVKPVDQYSFALKMGRALRRLDDNVSDKILIHVAGDAISIKKHLITYLEVDGHYVIYHSKEGDFSEYSTLSAAEKKIKSSSFVRCNRGCLVNLRYIESITRYFCVVDGHGITIARPQRNTLLSEYTKFLGGKNND